MKERNLVSKKGVVALPSIEYIAGSEELLINVEPLWEKLNLLHKCNSMHFTTRYINMTFDQRRSFWIEKSKDGQLRVDLVIDRNSKGFVAYCVTTITDTGVGEIESIYVDVPYRELGIGDKLVLRSLEWLDRRSVNEKRICVAGGNEQVLNFYSRYGFFPKMVVLEQVSQK